MPSIKPTPLRRPKRDERGYALHTDNYGVPTAQNGQRGRRVGKGRAAYAWVVRLWGNHDSRVAHEAGASTPDPFDGVGVLGNLLWRMQLRWWCGRRPLRFKLL